MYFSSRNELRGRKTVVTKRTHDTNTQRSVFWNTNLSVAGHLVSLWKITLCLRLLALLRFDHWQEKQKIHFIKETENIEKDKQKMTMWKIYFYSSTTLANIFRSCWHAKRSRCLWFAAIASQWPYKTSPSFLPWLTECQVLFSASDVSTRDLEW